MLPRLENLDEVLFYTNPHEWSPQSIYEAVKLFISNLASMDAAKFLSSYLLPKVRDNIVKRHGKLDVHLFQAMKKCAFKPAAFVNGKKEEKMMMIFPEFFLGILFPWAGPTSSNRSLVSLKEVSILCSVLSRISLPQLHGAACLVRLCETNAPNRTGNNAGSVGYCNSTSLVITALLNKKYNLPPIAVIAVARYFLSFKNVSHDSLDTTVIWHQSLLAFVTNYIHQIDNDNKNGLLELIKIRHHRQISASIKKVLMMESKKDDDIEEKKEDDKMIDE
jgi:essential nuclear protein 1